MLRRVNKILIRYIIAVLWPLIFILTGISCSKKLHPDASDNVIVYPSPPDTARFQFLTALNSSRDVEKKQSSFSVFVAGEEAPKGISKPYGMSLFHGKLYICDMDLPGIEIINFEKGTFDYFVPGGLGQLKLPINCFVDKQGFLYVADAKRRQIVVFDPKLKYVDSFGEIDDFKPVDVFVTEDKIWVANVKNKVHIYSKDSTHKLLRTIPDMAKQGDAGFLYQPTNIFVTEDEVYVSDFGGFNVKVLTHEGKYIRSIGSYGKNMGQFARPKGIAVDREKNLFVVDAAFENVQVFNSKDKFLMYFGGPYKGPGDLYLPAKVVLDYDNTKYFEKYVDKHFKLKYLILVSNNFGPDRINVYGRVEPKNGKPNIKGEKLASTITNK